MRKLMMSLAMMMFMIQPAFASTIYYNGSFQNSVDPSTIEFELDELKVPGDEVSESIHFKNVLDKKIHLSLELEKQDDTIYDFIIYQNDMKIYEKNMAETKEGTRIDLGVFENNQECDFTFKLAVPITLNNAYTNAKDECKWKLIIEEETDMPSTGLYANQVYFVVACGAFVLGLMMLGGKKNYE